MSLPLWISFRQVAVTIHRNLAASVEAAHLGHKSFQPYVNYLPLRPALQFASGGSSWLTMPGILADLWRRDVAEHV